MLIIAVSSQQILMGLAPTMHHANTPHSGEQFERDRRPTCLILAEFERHLLCLPLTIGETMFRRATPEEYDQWRKLFSS